MAFTAPPAVRPTAMTSASLPNFSKTPLRPPPSQRRSTLKRSIDETSSMDAPSSPTKRSRVKFESDVEIVSADEDDDLNPSVVREQVRRALERHLVGDDESYERLRGIFTTSPDKSGAPSTKALKYHIHALHANVTKLRKNCGTLIQAVVNSEWIGRGDNYITTFVRFLGSLAVAQTGFVGTITHMLVDLLGPQKTRRVSGSKPIREAKIHRRALESLRYLTQLVPVASSTLEHHIATKLDFEFSKADDRLTFVKSFMDLIKYVPELKGEILTNVMRQLIKLDTAIQVDLDDEDEDFEDEILQHMTSSQTLVYQSQADAPPSTTSDEDDAMSSSDEDSDSEDEEDQDPDALRRKRLRDDVRQVDVIMDTLFNYYNNIIGNADLETQDVAIEQLIAQFNTLILTTHRSRHPQFLIFHFAQSSPQRIDRFVTNCTGILLDQRYSAQIKHTAAAYLSGFVGRAAHVSKELVHDCLDLLCFQMNELYHKYERDCKGPDVKKYGDFYALYQAIMYIMCFRWQELCEVDADDEDDDLPGQPQKIAPLTHEIWSALHNASFSTLNPLRVCTAGIVEQFDVITHQLNWIYVHSKIDSNKRVRLMTSWRGASDLSIAHVERDMGWVGENGMLEGYFPYDPYHLPISKRWIEEDYVEWRGVPRPEEEEGSTEDDVEDDDDEDEGMDDADSETYSDED